MANFLQEHLNTEISLISHISTQKLHDDLIINYSSENRPYTLQIIPSGLLDQQNITPQIVNIEWSNSTAWFFRTQPDGDMPFDILSSIFYMVTRYEEFIIKERDKHQRFKATTSVAYKEKFITRPVVDLWLQQLRVLLNKHLSAPLPSPTYNFLPTVDIDSIYAYKRKPLYIQLGTIARHIYRNNWQQAYQQIKVHIGLENDPFDTFQMLQKNFAKRNIEPHIFLQVGNRGLYDKNINYKNRDFKRITHKLSCFAKIGVHVSYNAAFKQDMIQMEALRLQEIIKKPTTANRFHYLRLNLPDSYISLENCNITEDYSMGFADHIGYRAGTSKSYLWFDARANRETSLRVTPFVAMDGTLRKYMKCSPSESIELLKPIIEEAKQLNGQFCFLWHNSSFVESEGWKGWDDVFNWLITNG